GRGAGGWGEALLILGGQPAIPSRSHTSATSSKIEDGTVKGSVAEISSTCDATSSAVGSPPDSASQPSPRPMKTRAERAAQAEEFWCVGWQARVGRENPKGPASSGTVGGGDEGLWGRRARAHARP